MSEYGTSASGGSFSSSAGGSSMASDNTDTRALNSMETGPNGEADGDDLGTDNKSIQEGVFATLYTLTKNRTMDTSLRVAALRIVLEFLQFFRIAFNFSFAWYIDRDLWTFKAIEWILIRSLVEPKGYDMYITVFYILAAVILVTLLLTVWVALVLKGSDSVNPWLQKLISLLQLLALVVFCIAWPVVLDYVVFLFDCQWKNIQDGHPPYHMFFTEHSCTAMPHLAHMMFAAVIIIILAGLVLLMVSVMPVTQGGEPVLTALACTTNPPTCGMLKESQHSMHLKGVASTCDLNPMNVSLISSSDEVATIKMLVLKLIFILVATVLDQLTSVQAAIMTVAMWGVVFYLFDGVPFYSKTVNIIWGGLWCGIFDVTVILLVMQVTISHYSDPVLFTAFMTRILLYTIFPAVATGAGLMYLRLQQQDRIAKRLHNSFNVCKAAVMANMIDEGQRNGPCVSIMGDLKKVYRFRDVRQVKVMSREMRKWDEDGVLEPNAVEFGEFLIKCGMARMGNNPALLIMYSNFLIEARTDGQAARTQLQLAQKANPSVLDNYNIYVAQQLAKQLKRDGDALDLLSYVEFQRNYLACVRQHKAALLTQRAFWNSLLRDNISFTDLQASVAAMEVAEQRATSVYRRVMERYPGNGKVMKVYGRFLEYVRNEPGSAARYYDAALKAGTAESLLALTTAEGGAAGLAAAGQIDEKVDGLAVINAQGIIMMVNSACLQMFGYLKGELEGKNVSVLMPQPWSSRHDGFLQRYVESGQPHILNRTRAVVALHKDRHMFPLSLCISRLSGVGTDTLFIGVMRHEPISGTANNQVVKFWTTAGGIIMCSDSCMNDVLGIQPGELVGKCFSNLCTDVEGVSRYMATASQTVEVYDESGAVSAGPMFSTKMLHAFLPPVDVELSVQFGGHTEAGSDSRSIIIHARVLTDAAAVMEVDYKGRILHATAKLATLLGHPLAKMTKLELNNLIPQPICQMHGAWFKDPSLRIPATSCRAGSVVHLLAANGIRVPVTLKLTTREDVNNGHTTHVVQVTKATEELRLDQQRMLLGINHKGTVVTVNKGVPRTLFGFDGQQLVNQPLSSAIDIFSDWKEGHGEELSLLELLVRQTMSADPAATKAGSFCASWRVGIHRPTSDEGRAHKDVDAGTHHSSLLHALQPNRVQPACMKLEAMLREPGDLLDGDVSDDLPILQVSLHRSDALTTVIDLDKDLKIAKADDAAGLMFGVHAKQLMRHFLPKLLGLHGIKHFDDLLGKSGTAKKGAMKTSSAAASRAGNIQKVTAKHLGDGQPLVLSMQAMAYEQGGRSRRVVRLQLVNAVSAAMERLLEIKEAGMQSGDLARMDTMAAEEEGSRSHSSKGSEPGAALAAEPSGADEPEPPAGAGKKADRIRDWVRQASNLDAFDGEGDGEVPSPKRKGPQQSRLGRMQPGAASDDDADGVVHMRVPVHSASAGKDTFRPTGKSMFDESDSEDYGAPSGPRFGPDSRVSGGADSDAGESHVGSMADGLSDAGSGIESSVAAGGMAHDEVELAVDMRRVKRLKKIQRMLSSGIAQATTTQWRKNTVYLLGIILVAHIACFAVIVTQIEARHANAVAVNNIALGMSSASQSVLRMNFLRQCAKPEFASYYVCQPEKIADYGARLHSNTEKFRHYHHMLYLGGGGVAAFTDPRLISYWTYKQLPETTYYEAMADGLPAFKNDTRTLWVMGNVLLSNLDDVYFFKDAWGAQMELQPEFQYAYLNMPTSIYTGYAWSLDTFVDFTWQDLTKLSVIIIVLLVMEAVVVQLSCMAYEFLLLQHCNVSHMRLFSVFLALPSATVRFMVRKPMIVDDSSNDEVDDDDLDLADAGAAAGAGQAAVATTTEEDDKDKDKDKEKEKKKSVRLAADDSDADDDDGKAFTKLKQSSARFKEKVSSLAAKKNPKAPTGFAGFKKKVMKHLFGWLDPRFKRNGKKLIPSSRIILHFMAPLLLWVAAVVIIYGVSYSNLQGLQGPLASLDLAAHVMYRLTRSRLTANLLAFSTSAADNGRFKSELKQEVELLREEYRTLLYGGRMRLQAEVTFEPYAPPAVLANPELSDIFFKTTQCLREDTSGCFDKTNENYMITHSGLDAQVNRFLDEMITFSNLPDALALANHSSYEFTSKVTARDTFDGLQKAAGLFVAGTLEKLDSVKQLHVILLAISLCALVVFVLMLYRPYIKALKRDTKAVVNMLSQLPAEVDVEGQVKSIVLGIAKTDGSKSVEGLMPGPFNQMQPFGMGPGAGMRGGGSWFGRGNAGPQAPANDSRMYSYGVQNGYGMQYGMGMLSGMGMQYGSEMASR